MREASSRGPFYLLLGLAALYFGVSLTLSDLRFHEFTTSNWDLGIFQQGLWTTFHGHVFYEAGDWETSGSASFLQVHPALILFALAPVYFAAPDPLTLFVIQSAVVAAAVFPLFGIARQVIGRSGPALGIAGLYLASGPLLAANVFDVHLEALIPLEIFSLFYLWNLGRYRLGMAVAVATYLTLEVTPFLVAGLALFFLIPPMATPLGGAGRRLYRWVRAHPLADLRAGGERWRRYLDETKGRWSLYLLLSAIIVYPLLRLFEWYLLPWMIGAPPLPAAGGLTAPIQAAGIPVDFAFGTHLGNKVGYWALMVALLGFLPLFAPRGLLLVTPWFLFTMQAALLVWTLVGFQYSFIPMATLPIAAIYGFRNVELRILPWLVARVRRWATARRGATAVRPAEARAARRPAPVIPNLALGAFFVVLVVANVTVGPVNPARQNLASGLSGYTVTYAIPPGFDEVVAVVQLIPTNATILASSNLFPLVANNPAAYALLWTNSPPPYLPFSGGYLPQYVFLSQNQLGAVPIWLSPLLTNPAVYGLRAIVWQAPPGPVLLYALNYTGSYIEYGSPAPAPYVLTGAALGPTSAGKLETIAGSPVGSAVVSQGRIYAPFLFSQFVHLTPGIWTFTISVARLATQPDPPPGPGPQGYSLALNLTGFGHYPWAGDFFFNQTLPLNVWVQSTITVLLTQPTLDVGVVGTVLRVGAVFAVAKIVVTQEAG